MDRGKFFDAIRPTFNGGLDQGQVDGMSALLDAGSDLPLHHMAHVLANVQRETGGIMAPIKETVLASHKNRNPSDAEVARRLERAWTAGKLPWVRTPYWRDIPSWFGRGQIQITHRDNYLKFGITDPNDALKLEVSARIAVEGMRDGKFRGRKLSDYRFPQALSSPPDMHPRRIVNGRDGSDSQVSGWHRRFADALEVAGWGKLVTKPVETAAPSKLSWIARILRGIRNVE